MNLTCQFIEGYEYGGRHKLSVQCGPQKNHVFD